MFRQRARVSLCVLAVLLLLQLVGPEWLHAHAPLSQGTPACAGCVLSLSVGLLPAAVPAVSAGETAVRFLPPSAPPRDDRKPICEVLSRGPP